MAVKLICEQNAKTLHLFDDDVMVVFSQKQLSLARTSRNFAFCKDERGRKVLERLFPPPQQQSQHTGRVLFSATHTTMSKTDLEDRFSKVLWPRLELFANGLVKLKRLKCFPALFRFIFPSCSGLGEDNMRSPVGEHPGLLPFLIED